MCTPASYDGVGASRMQDCRSVAFTTCKPIGVYKDST
jgi:hypothetical protein